MSVMSKRHYSEHVRKGITDHPCKEYHQHFLVFSPQSFPLSLFFFLSFLAFLHDFQELLDVQPTRGNCLVLLTIEIVNQFTETGSFIT